MKKAFFSICLIISISFFFSCASNPDQIVDIPDSSIAESNESTSPEEIQGEDLTAKEIQKGTERDNKIESPDIIQTPIMPEADRLLYFYPEPEAILSLPEIKASNDTLLELPVVEPPVEQKILPPSVKEIVEPTKESTQQLQSDETVGVEPTKEMPGIWESEPVAPSFSHLRSASGITPSRSVLVYSNQTLEVWYPGSGWVYLGDASSRNGLSYQTRKLDGQDTLFTFKAKTPGSYILEFSRFDVLSDSFSSDALAVTVKESEASRTGKVRSPNFTFNEQNSSLSKIASDSENKAQSSISSVISDEPVLRSIPEQMASEVVNKTEDPSVLLGDIKKALSNSSVDTALNLLDQYFSVATTDMDEGWFLRGQAYEANSDKRDIRKALNAYETLVSAYPDSQRWQEADYRIRYIRQFYLRIR